MEKKSSLANDLQFLIGEVKRLMNNKVFTFSFIQWDSVLGRIGGIYFRNIGPWLIKAWNFPVEIMKFMLGRIDSIYFRNIGPWLIKS